jgi:hypothetical protein
MAGTKKKIRKPLTSKGIHSAVSRGTLTAMRRDVGSSERLGHKIEAWKKMQNPWLTIKNPDKSATNRLFIRVRANQHWGDPRPKREGPDRQEA